MKSVMRKSVLLAGAFLVCTVASASASWNVMEVNVPFAFVVNGHTLPAGQYTVEQEDGTAVLIRGERDNHAAAIVMTVAAGEHDLSEVKPTLTFTRDENHYRLSSLQESPSEGWTVISR
jgi:hypothetical protein